MLVEITLVYRWGKTSKVTYDTGSPDERQDLIRFLRRLPTDSDVTNFEIHILKEILLEDLLKEIL